METLTDRQLRFAYEYLKDQNASAAAVRAGYSEKTCASQANELMNNPAVRECIRIELESMLAELKVTMLDLVRERRKAAFFRAGKMFDAAGEVLALAEMEAETREALLVTVVTRKWGPEIRMRQPDRDKALAALEKVQDRLERQNERHYEKLEREAARPGDRGQVQEPAPAPATEWPALRLASEKEPARDVGRAPVLRQAQDERRQGMKQEGVTAAPHPAATPGPSKIAGKPQVLSGSTLPSAEKPQVPQGDFFQGVLSGSAAKEPKPSPFAKLRAAFHRKKEEPIVRRDPNLLRGGTQQWTPLPPSPYLFEHLARLRREAQSAASG